MTELQILNEVNCEGCGKCCMHVGHPMFVHDEPSYISLPANLRKAHDEYMESLDGDDLGEPCYWLDLDSLRCRNYEHRPRVCREFEVGGEGCLETRSRVPERL